MEDFIKLQEIKQINLKITFLTDQVLLFIIEGGKFSLTYEMDITATIPSSDNKESSRAIVVGFHVFKWVRRKMSGVKQS